MANRRGLAIRPDQAQAAVAAHRDHGSVSAAARALGLTRPALQRRLKRAETWGLVSDLPPPPANLAAAPRRAGVTRYLLTAAQSNTLAHDGLWANLSALADHLGARIMVGRIRYNHTREQVAQEKDDGEAQDSLWYDARLLPRVCDERVALAPGLTWAGDMNILPTATDPLSGLDSFAGSDSVIFPHPQVALRSVATTRRVPVKMLYTTGAVTVEHYIRRKAGLKAAFHHSLAALLVEVDAAGDWWARQVIADAAGTVHDLDLRVEGGRVEPGHRLAVLTPGDIHGRRVDPGVLEAVWGEGGLVDALRPEAQVLHDVLDFGARSHHLSLLDALSHHYRRTESVAGEIAETAAALNRMLRPRLRTVIAKGNHDEHLERWVRDADWRRDPPNAAFYLAAAAAVVAAVERGEDRFDLAAWALRRAGLPPEVEFLGRDDSLVIAGVDHGQHGDLGPNGARGSAANLSRLGVKANIGHSHSAAIRHGCWQAGTSSLLEMGYNRGPSSWSHSAILTYATGKRALVTLRGRKWRAEA